MPKKSRKSPASFVKVVAKRAAKNPKVASAVAMGKDGLVTVGVPAGVALVGSRIVSYLAHRLAKGNGAAEAGWRSALEPHAATLGSLFFLAMTWYATSKVKALGKYQKGALIGAAVATGLTVVQSYILKPKQLPPPATNTRRSTSPAPSSDYEYQGDEPGTEGDIDGLDGFDGSGGEEDLSGFQTGIFAPSN